MREGDVGSKWHEEAEGMTREVRALAWHTGTRVLTRPRLYVTRGRGGAETLWHMPYAVCGLTRSHDG